MARKLRKASIGLIGACALLLAACGSEDDASATAETPATTATTTVATTAAPTTATPTTAVEAVPDDAITDVESPVIAFDPEATPLTTQFEFLENDVYRVDTIGTPFSFEVTDALFVWPNSEAFFVVGHPNGQGPDDRDIVFFRVSDLADPLQPAAAAGDQVAWPANDIEGWLGALGDDILVSNRSETTVGGRNALQFDMQLSDDAECSEEDFFCVGFATNRLVNGKSLEPRAVYRTWWIDEGEESPIAIVAGIKSDSELDWFDTAESLLGSMAFGETAANPIPTEGDLWTLGFTTDVPAGVVEVPVLGGLRFELAEDRFVIQDPMFGVMIVPLDEEPADSEFQIIDRTAAGDPIVTTQDAIDELITVVDEVIEVETTTVAGFPTRVVDVSGEGFGPMFVSVGVDLDDGGWGPPLAGRLWFIESDRGLLLATAEVFAPSAPLDEVIAQTTSILSTLEFVN